MKRASVNRQTISVLAVIGSVFAAGQVVMAQPSLAWAARQDGGESAEDLAGSVRTDAQGNSIVVGSVTNAAGDTDTLVVKYDVFGNKVWEAKYAGPAAGNDDPWALAVDASGNAYVAINSWGGAANDVDLVTAKVLADGTVAWAKRYNGTGSGEDAQYGFDMLGLDGAGNVYVSGYSYSSTGYYEFVTIRYSPGGAQQWVQRYASPYASDPDAYAYGMAVSSAGDVYVCGESRNIIGDVDYTVVKYNAGGAQQWAKQYDGTAHGYDGMYQCALDPSGNLAVVGISQIAAGYTARTIKIDPAGTQLWAADYGTVGFNYGWNVRCDSGGNVVIGVARDSGIGYQLDTVKYSATGSLLWIGELYSQWAEDSTPSQLAIDDQDNIYVAGTTWQGFGRGDDMVLIKYSPNGVEQWNEQWNGAANGQDGAFDVTVDNLNQVIVCGYSLGLGTSTDMEVWKYRPEKAELTVNPNPPVHGQQATLTVSAFEPNQQAYLVYSTAGLGSTNVFALGVTLDLTNPKLIGSATTNAAGTATWTVNVPNPAAGVNVWFQAAQYGQTSTVLATTIQ